MDWWKILSEKRYMAMAVASRLSIIYDVYFTKEEKEDLVSDMLIGAFRKLVNSNYDPAKAKVSTYVWRALSWVYKDHMRKRAKRQADYFDPAILEKRDADDDPNTKRIKKKLFEKSLEREKMEEKNKILRKAIEKISNEKWRRVFKLQAEGYTIREISKIMDLPEGTVKTYMRRAKEFLKDFFLHNYYV